MNTGNRDDQVFGHNARELAEEIWEVSLLKRAEFKEKYKEETKREKCIEDIIYILRYLESAVFHNSPVLFSDFIQWLKKTLAQYSIHAEEIAVTLQALEEVLKEKMEEKETPLIHQVLQQGFEVLKS